MNKLGLRVYELCRLWGSAKTNKHLMAWFKFADFPTEKHLTGLDREAFNLGDTIGQANGSLRSDMIGTVTNKNVLFLHRQTRQSSECNDYSSKIWFTQRIIVTSPAPFSPASQAALMATVSLATNPTLQDETSTASSLAEASAATAADVVDNSIAEQQRSGLFLRLVFACGRACRRIWQFTSLVVLLAVAASIPILQFASLGYLLESAGRWARGEKLGNCLPGMKQAGYIGTAFVWIGLSSLPVTILRDLAASARLINPGSEVARNWQIGATIAWVVWVFYVWWAILRGGRAFHFLWPAPLRFVKEFFLPRTWAVAIDRLAAGIARFRIFYLLKFGFIGAVGTLMYLAIPGGIMIAGIRAQNDGVKGILTLIGAISMAVILQYLPFAQMRYAKTKQFRSFLKLRDVRQGFRRAPWLHAISVLLLVIFSLPMYLLRIEMPPAQLVWLLCVFFVLFNIPTKFMIAWAVRYSDQRFQNRAWYNRWPAWLVLVAGLPVYVLFLYLAALASWDGSAVMILQHAFLTPVPFLPQ